MQRLRDHLIRTHKIDNGSEKLKALIKKAKPVLYESEESEEAKVEIKTEHSSPIEISSEEDVNIKKEVDEETEMPMLKIKKQTSSAGKLNVCLFRKKNVIDISSSDEDDKIKEEQEVNDAKTSCEEEASERKVEYKDGKDSEKDDSEYQKGNIEDIDAKFFQDKIIRKFIRWLQKPPNSKGRQNAIQHGAQAFHVWNFMTPKRTIEGLLEKRKLDEWIHMATDKKALGTINSYVGSVVQLINYLLDDEKIAGLEVERATRFKLHTKLTSKQLRKKIRTRRTVVKTEEIGKLIFIHFNTQTHTHTT